MSTATYFTELWESRIGLNGDGTGACNGTYNLGLINKTGGTTKFPCFIGGN